MNNVVHWQQKAAKAQDTELECKNLRETLEQYNVEFSEVKNQGKNRFVKLASYEHTFTQVPNLGAQPPNCQNFGPLNPKNVLFQHLYAVFP